jgi:hypothetical protein
MDFKKIFKKSQEIPEKNEKIPMPEKVLSHLKEYVWDFRDLSRLVLAAKIGFKREGELVGEDGEYTEYPYSKYSDRVIVIHVKNYKEFLLRKILSFYHF